MLPIREKPSSVFSAASTRAQPYSTKMMCSHARPEFPQPTPLPWTPWLIPNTSSASSGQPHPRTPQPQQTRTVYPPILGTLHLAWWPLTLLVGASYTTSSKMMPRGSPSKPAFSISAPSSSCCLRHPRWERTPRECCLWCSEGCCTRLLPLLPPPLLLPPPNSPLQAQPPIPLQIYATFVLSVSP